MDGGTAPRTGEQEQTDGEIQAFQGEWMVCGCVWVCVDERENTWNNEYVFVTLGANRHEEIHCKMYCLLQPRKRLGGRWFISFGKSMDDTHVRVRVNE